MLATNSRWGIGWLGATEYDVEYYRCRSVFRDVENLNNQHVFCAERDIYGGTKFVKHNSLHWLDKHRTSVVAGDSGRCVMATVVHRFLGCAVELECLSWLCMTLLSTVTCSSDTWLSIESAFLWRYFSSSSWFSWLEFVPREIPDLPFRMGQLLLLFTFQVLFILYRTSSFLELHDLDLLHFRSKDSFCFY